MKALREFPPNPHAVVYHVDDRLTDQIVETYLSAAASPRAWVREALAIPGVRVVSLNAYKVRLQKHKDASWCALLPAFENVLRTGLPIGRIDELVETESRHRHFCWHGAPFDRKVYEGRLQAQGHPLAAELFLLRGVAEVILDGNRVQVRKCPLVDWRDLAPEVEGLLASG